MDYIDLEGKIIKNTTDQDRLLEFLYTNPLGQFLLKPLVGPGFSRWTGKLLSTRLSTRLIPFFLRKNAIDMSDYEKRTYTSFNDFFTRKLRPGLRPLAGGSDTLISPCDCRALIYPVRDGSIFSVKHTEYTLRSLLRSPSLARRFQGGYIYILRLTVDDYHRYIYAASGRQSKNYHIKGTYHTVNPVANDYLPIYKENAREYTVLHTDEFGDVLQMEVGALMVGKICNHRESVSVRRGEEKGFFEYGGSTIILLTKKDAVEPRPDLLRNTEKGYETRLLQGQELGRAATHSGSRRQQS